MDFIYSIVAQCTEVCLAKTKMVIKEEQQEKLLAQREKLYNLKECNWITIMHMVRML